MSFTILYYTPSDAPDPGEERVLETLDRVPHLRRAGQPGDYHHVYENRDTGVEFTFDFRDPKRLREEEELEHQHQFEGWRASGLSATVAYLRPSFFGLEAFPWIHFTARSLGLKLLDTQREGASRAGPVLPDVNTLIASWDASNERATRTLRSQEGIDMASGDRRTLDAWWRYVTARSELESGYAGRAAVSTPWLARDERAGLVVSVAEASLETTIVIPAEATLLNIERERRRFRILNVVDRGTVRTEAFLRAAGTALERHEDPVPHFVFSPDRLDATGRAAIAQLAVDVRARFGRVLATRLTDVVPATG